MTLTFSVTKKLNSLRILPVGFSNKLLIGKFYKAKIKSSVSKLSSWYNCAT